MERSERPTVQPCGASTRSGESTPALRGRGADRPPQGRAWRRGSSYRTLLVPLDGSPLAECALPFAHRLATLAGARLMLVRAVRNADDAVRAKARVYLDALAESLGGVGLVVGTSLPEGEVADAVAAAAEGAPADLIIAASSGCWLLGRGGADPTPALLARVAQPLLLVRGWHHSSAFAGDRRRGTAVARIVVPLDGSAPAELALSPAREFVSLLGGELILVRAVPAMQPGVPGRLVRRTDIAEEYLRGVAAGLVAEGIAACGEVRPGDPAAVIEAAIRRHDAALVVMATHGESAIAGTPLGSVARRVLWGAAVPSALIRPPRLGARIEQRASSAFGVPDITASIARSGAGVASG